MTHCLPGVIFRILWWWVREVADQREWLEDQQHSTNFCGGVAGRLIILIVISEARVFPPVTYLSAFVLQVFNIRLSLSLCTWLIIITIRNNRFLLGESQYVYLSTTIWSKVGRRDNKCNTFSAMQFNSFERRKVVSRWVYTLSRFLSANSNSHRYPILENSHGEWDNNLYASTNYCWGVIYAWDDRLDI